MIKAATYSYEYFINTAAANAVSKTYARINAGVTDINMEIGPETESTQYIGDKAQTNEVKNYNFTCTFDIEPIIDDPAYKFFRSRFEEEPTYSDCDSDFVYVDTNKEVKANGEGTGEYYAEERHVAAYVNNFDTPAGDLPKLNVTLAGKGDKKRGKFSPTTKTFTEGTMADDGTFTPAST